MLERILRERKKDREILLMTHIVMGYPDFEQSYRLIETMVEAGVDAVELQIPYTEPMADGPVIVNANQMALAAGSSLEKCFDFAERVTSRFDIPFLFMSYYNILYKYGVAAFAKKMKALGMVGAIVPDLPPEEGAEYLEAMRECELSPVFIFTPSTTDARLKYVAQYAKGLVYCVARQGVTGAQTEFEQELDGYLDRCRGATDLPLALGFGIKSRKDVDYLKGKVDIAVVGSQTIRVLDEDGVEAAGAFIRSLR